MARKRVRVREGDKERKRERARNVKRVGLESLINSKGCAFMRLAHGGLTPKTTEHQSGHDGLNRGYNLIKILHASK